MRRSGGGAGFSSWGSGDPHFTEDPSQCLWCPKSTHPFWKPPSQGGIGIKVVPGVVAGWAVVIPRVQLPSWVPYVNQLRSDILARGPASLTHAVIHRASSAGADRLASGHGTVDPRRGEVECSWPGSSRE